MPPVGRRVPRERLATRDRVRRPGIAVVVQDFVFQQMRNEAEFLCGRFVGPLQLHAIATVVQVAVEAAEEREFPGQHGVVLAECLGAKIVDRLSLVI